MSGDVPLPDWATLALADGEAVRWARVPIRRAGGPLGVYSIMVLGVAFTFASGVALVEMAGRYDLSMGVGRVMLLALIMALCTLWLVFSLMMLVWPLLSGWAMRNQIAIVTDRRVLHVRRRVGNTAPPRVKATPLSECTHVQVVRRRGESATLVLSEGLRERAFDGRTVYEWNCIHGLPDADGAQAAIERGLGSGHGGGVDGLDRGDRGEGAAHAVGGPV